MASEHCKIRAAGRDRHLILWDGACGFCRRCVDWVQAHDTHGRFAAMPYQEVPSPPMTPEMRAACARAVHVIESDGHVLRGGRACMFILRALGWRVTGTIGALPPFVWAVEAAYRYVSTHRAQASRVLRSRSSPTP